ncbi:MAG TPA: HDOD domain-containing protein, partial [candidate division Zixibacteria bacterium]|nr:HDOD domain-containing protein [candidate division Zixibacteria bacterium]
RNLPTPPVVFHQIQKVISDPNASAAQVAAILGEDPAMSVKVLKLTNSVFYGLAREVESVKQAVVVVGMEAIKNLVLSASVLDMFKGNTLDQERQERFWRHSLATAFCSRLIARSVRDRGMIDPDSAFSAGLLHDVGKLVIECFLAQEYAKFAAVRCDNVTATDLEIERETLGYTHDHLGGFLAMQWKLPQRLGDAIAFHHSPTAAPAPELLACIVHSGNFVAKHTFYGREDQHLIGHPDPEALAKLGIDEGRLEGFADKLRDEYAKAETFMQMLGLTG